jgi:UDP-N-acetylglucosamine 2-epimerase
MVITFSNADFGGGKISRRLDEFASDRENVVVHASLGQEAYLSCLANFDLVIGNSSSAIIEAPIFGLPTVNVGGRQKGREMAPSVINVDCKYESIKGGVDNALRRPRYLKQNIYDLPYGKLGATASILAVLEQFSCKQVRSV